MKLVNREEFVLVLAQASILNDMDTACAMVQDAMGQTDGGLCAQYFDSVSQYGEDGGREEWPKMALLDRLQWLTNYAAHERDVWATWAEIAPTATITDMNAEARKEHAIDDHDGVGPARLAVWPDREGWFEVLGIGSAPNKFMATIGNKSEAFETEAEVLAFIYANVEVTA